MSLLGGMFIYFLQEENRTDLIRHFFCRTVHLIRVVFGQQFSLPMEKTMKSKYDGVRIQMVIVWIGLL